MRRAISVDRRLLGRIGTIVTLSLLAVIAIIPIFWMLLSSLKTEDEIFRSSPTVIPEAVTLDNYTALFDQFAFGRLTLNSVIISAGVVFISVAFGGMAAYGFSRYPFRGGGVLLAALLLTRMITPAALVIPLYLIMDTLGLLNTLTSIIVGVSVLNLPFAIWLLKPFFDAVPREIEEAGLIDGLTPFGVFFRVAMPLAVPGLITVGLFSFIAGWTDLLFPMTFSTTVEATPLTSGLLQMQTGYRIYWGALMAGGIYLTLPTLLVSFGLQRYLVRGMRMSY